MTAELTSSSPKIGDREQTLTVRVQPWSLVSGEGTMVINVPPYFKNARNEYYFNSMSPTPCHLNATKQGQKLTTRVKSCTFSRQRRLELAYIVDVGKDLFAYDQVELFFTISRFNNPVTELRQANVEGISVEIDDKEGYAVSSTGPVLGVTGVKKPITFTSHDFIYADKANANETAVHTLVFKSAMPVPFDCNFKIVYPP